MHSWYELNRKACGCIVRAGNAAVGNSSMGSDPMEAAMEALVVFERLA